MFNERNKPLNRLCDEITLNRISTKDYSSFIQRFAKKKWGEPLSSACIDTMVDCTKRHPYYMNALLRSLFLCTRKPSANSVLSSWQELAQKKRSDLLAETKPLNMLHKKLLVAIANGINTELTGKTFLAKADASSASVVRGLDYLVCEDFIEKQDKCYTLIDPLLETVIKQLQIL